MNILHYGILEATASVVKRYAALGLYDGSGSTPSLLYLNRQTVFHQPTATLLLFTRDTGHHTSGWWKNPDYERCYHLSLSFRSLLDFDQPRPKNKKITERWLNAFYGEEKRKLWCEPPYSAEGKALDVWHYRLFCDSNWQPIIPRGEVYTKQFTEAGWKSYSDLQPEAPSAEAV